MVRVQFSGMDGEQMSEEKRKMIIEFHLSLERSNL
jgi:hypothetical protein